MKILSRIDIAQRTDRATRATTLRYVGRGLVWTNVLYGQPEGVFFALSASEVPLPEDRLAPLAEEAGVLLDDHPDVSRIRVLAEAALIAEAWVAAPELLRDITEMPLRWLDSDRLGLERKHQNAVYALEDQVVLVERDLRRRILSRSIGAPRPTVAAAAPHRAPGISDAAARRVEEAAREAREAELQQRLPGGARRALAKLTPGAYISVGADLERHDSIGEAMRAAAARGAETVLDWDGEWPVVVRRYEGGRVVYRVEEALRRVDEAEENAA